MLERNNNYLHYELRLELKDRGGESPLPSRIEEICFNQSMRTIDVEEAEDKERFCRGLVYLSK